MTVQGVKGQKRGVQGQNQNAISVKATRAPWDTNKNHYY